MKCTNCGFDAENDSVCPVCGHNLVTEAAAPVQSSPQNTQTENAVPYQQPQPPQGYAQNPYYQPQNTQPYIQQPYPPQQPQQPYPPQQQSAQPYQPQQPQMQANPAFQAPPAPNAPKKSINAGVIVLITIVGAVIVIGIFLAVFSTVFSTVFLGSITEKSSEKESAAVYDSDIDVDYDTELFPKLDISKYTVHKVGETVDLGEHGSLTLKTAEKPKGSKVLDEDYIRYAVTIEIKNTTDSDISADIFGYSFYDEDGNDFLSASDNTSYKYDLEYVYSDRSSNFEDKLKPGETATEIIYFNAKKNISKTYITFEEYFQYDSDADSGTICYEVDLTSIK